MREFEIKNRDGLKLAGTLEDGDKEKPLVLLCHGLTSSKDSSTYTRLAEELKKNHVGSYRFDFHGHGKSEGEFEKFNFEIGKQNILDVIEFLKEQGYSKFIVSGSSFMGVCAILAAAENENIIALTLLSPGSGSRNYDFIYDIAARLTLPVCIIHGTEDDVVPVENSEKLAKVIPHCELEIVEGADHIFSDKKEIRTKKVVGFIKKIIKS